ncbi:nucleoside diphosphate kinase, mitochondrial isoform X2 [Balearica regulorum gibbericeps]|uniref:nucleoside diphosphate kinase, mitochondrial isoform X2 n=1 Tax=Balearica regulorum gibbericeps TaxID=100784 RepID=UPI003F5E0B73
MGRAVPWGTSVPSCQHGSGRASGRAERGGRDAGPCRAMGGSDARPRCPTVPRVTVMPDPALRPLTAPPELQEKTLVLVKPDAVQRRLVGNVIQRFERRGFKLVAMKLLQADQGLLDKHYQQLRQKPFYPALLAYMTSGPLVAMERGPRQ